MKFMCLLLGFSGRFCSYWQPNFPAVSVVTCRDFLAYLSWHFSGMGNLKKLYGQQANCSGIYSGIFCP
jgi:hypothetical protein